MSEHESHKAIWPTFALRAWLGALGAQIHRARKELEDRIEASEKEIARLRRQHERAGSVLKSLHEAIEKVDARLRMVRDTEYVPSAEKHGDPGHHEPERGGERDPSARGAAEGNHPEPNKPADEASKGKENNGPSSTRGSARPR